MHKHAFQGLKRMFIHVSGLPPTYFEQKINYFLNWFFETNYGEEDMRHAKTSVSGPTSYFDKKQTNYYIKCFFLKKKLMGEDLRHT